MHEGEEGWHAPAAAPYRQDREGEQEGEPGPGQQDHRDPPGVLQEVGREHVGQRGHDRTRAPQPQDPREVEDPGPGGEQDRPEPEALGHPDRHVQEGQEAEEGAHGEEVADVLVVHRAEADGGVPHEGHLGQEAARIEIQVGLGVRRHHARPHDEQGDVGQERQQRRPRRPSQAQLARLPAASRSLDRRLRRSGMTPSAER